MESLMQKGKLFRSAILSFVTAAVAAPGLAQTDTSNAGAGGDPETAIIKAILTKEAIRIIEGNISASERENGEINKLIRALSGVSVKDIETYGICGGPNAEVRKLFGSICK
jgi:hypothetical protein